MSRSKIVVLDFGSQYAHLIAKRFRMLGYYSEIVLPSAPLSEFSDARGIVFSGGPASIYGGGAPEFNKEILTLDVPILGLCYGHYVVNAGCNGKIKKAAKGEFGFAELHFDEAARCPLFEGITSPQQVWMSHQDEVAVPGDGFEAVGSTAECRYAALQNISKKRFSMQFHCEVKDTPCGDAIFSNFARFCGLEKNWNKEAVLNVILEETRRKAAGRKVLLFLSGGVDSTVTFALLNRALGQERVLGLHIDNGFMRKGESAEVAAAYRRFGFQNFIVEDASKAFLDAVAGITDPQKKRVAVGETFVAVRNAVIARQNLDESEWLLAQGTLYPDIIESGGTKNANTIKTHHNRVAGIQSLIERGLVIEPIRDLYKDEVRGIGRALGLDDALVMRHPFPGPGLSINVLCSDGVMGGADEADFAAAESEIKGIRLTQFCEKCASALKMYILPVRSVGVQGDFRTYRFPAALSFAPLDGGFYHLPKKWEKVEAASSQITNSAEHVNRTVIRLWQNPNVPDGGMRLCKGYCDRLRLDQLREADAIVLSELRESGWYGKIFQHLTIMLPFASDESRCSFVLRPVCSEDVMTARFAWLSHEVLESIVRKIAALPFADAVFFDATNKPPATFGWE